MAKNKTSSTVWLRRVTQTVFLLLFFYLFLLTAYRPDNVAGGPVTLFFDFDPLIMLTVWLGGHAVASALLLSLITLGATLIFGRWFCGWVCPFGALHNLFTSMRKVKASQKIKTGGYSVWQKTKYYILIAVLVGAFFGANLAGWLDPFSFFFRSMAVAVFPAVNAGLQGFFQWMYEVDPIKLSVLTEPIYNVLRQYFLAFDQPHYFWGMLLGTLFGVIIALNFFRSRFWCRYICPLGALLGLFGKNPTIRLNVDPEKCNDCSVCVMDCLGGADPQSTASWKPSECFFCWNCHSGCPQEAISFKFQVPGGGDKS
ncbi:4Fe-4S binding protein [Deltaproteobacteria bacterium]|nr:4Fe-4S binding protein [Deltaproteobacteria bacterium]